MKISIHPANSLEWNEFLLRENEGGRKRQRSDKREKRVLLTTAPLDRYFRFARLITLESFEKRGGWRETEPNGNENENENVDERRDLRNAGGGKGGWTKKGRGKPRAKAGAVTRNARPGMCYRSCRVPRLRYLYSARTSAIHSFTSDESSRDDVGDAGRGHRYKAEEGTNRRIDKKD